MNRPGPVVTRCGGVVLDTRRIERLVCELDSRSHAEGVVARFVERLPDRLGSVHKNLHEGKSDGALVAILSVATSAAMTGAVQLEEHSRSVEQSIRAGNLAEARAAAGVLDANAADFAVQVSAFFGRS